MILFILKFANACFQNLIFLIDTEHFSKTRAINWLLSAFCVYSVHHYPLLVIEFFPLLSCCFIGQAITNFWFKNHYLCSNVRHFGLSRHFQNRLWQVLNYGIKYSQFRWFLKKHQWELCTQVFLRRSKDYTISLYKKNRHILELNTLIYFGSQMYIPL